MLLILVFNDTFIASIGIFIYFDQSLSTAADIKFNVSVIILYQHLWLFFIDFTCLQLPNFCSDQQANYKVEITNIDNGSIMELGLFNYQADRNPHVELKISLGQEQMYSCVVVIETEIGTMTSETIKFSESLKIIDLT